MLSPIYTLHPDDCEFVDARDGAVTVECLRVDVAVGVCGHAFTGIAHIIEADGPCPKLMIGKPLGLTAVTEIIEIFNRRKAAAVPKETPK